MKTNTEIKKNESLHASVYTDTQVSLSLSVSFITFCNPVHQRVTSHGCQTLRSVALRSLKSNVAL